MSDIIAIYMQVAAASITDAPTLTRTAPTFALRRQSQSFSRSHQSTRRRHRGVRSKIAESRLKSPARKLRAGPAGFPLPFLYTAARRAQTDERMRAFGIVNLHKFADKDNSPCLSRLIDRFALVPSNRSLSASNGSLVSYPRSEYPPRRGRPIGEGRI